MQKQVLTVLLAAVSASALSFAADAPGTVPVANLSAETRANKTFKTLAAAAAGASNDSNQLQSLASDDLSPDWQRDRLEHLKTEINSMGRDISLLLEHRDLLAPWQLQTMDSIVPMVADAARQTDDVIRCFNQNSRSHSRDLAGRISADTTKVASTLKGYLKVDKVIEREARLEGRIFGVAGY